MARFRSHWLLVLTALNIVSSSDSEVGSLAFKYARGGQSEISDDVKRFIGVFDQSPGNGAQSFSFGSANRGSVAAPVPVQEIPQPAVPLPAPVPLIAPAPIESAPEDPASPTCTDIFCNRIFNLLKNPVKSETTDEDEVVPSEKSRDRVLSVLKENYLKIAENINQSFMHKKNNAILKSVTSLLKSMKGLYGDKFETVAKELIGKFWKTYGKIEKANQGESAGQEAAIKEIDRVKENLKKQAGFYKNKLKKLYRKFKRVLRKKKQDFGDPMSQIFDNNQDQQGRINQVLINKVRNDLSKKLDVVTRILQKYSPKIFKDTILEDKSGEQPNLRSTDDDAYQLPGKVYEIVHEVADAQPDDGSNSFFRYFTRIYKKISVSLEEKSEDFLRLFVRSCFELSDRIPDTIERYAVRFYKIFKSLYDIVSDKLHAGCSDDFIEILKQLSITLNYTLGRRSESNFKKEFIRKWHLKFDNSYNDIYHYYAEKGSSGGSMDFSHHVQKVYEKSRSITPLDLEDYPDEEQQLFKYLSDEIGSDFSFASPEKSRMFMRIYKERQRSNTSLGEYLKDLYKLFDRTYDSIERDAIKNEDDFLKVFIAICQEFFGENGQQFWKNYKYFTSFFHSVWKYTLKEKKSDSVQNELADHIQATKPGRDLEEQTSNSLIVPSNELPRITEEERNKIIKKLADLIGQRFNSQPKDFVDIFISVYNFLHGSMKTNLDEHIIELHALFTTIQNAVQRDLTNNLQAFIDIFAKTAKSHFGNSGEKIWTGWRDFYQCFMETWKKYLHDKEAAAVVTESSSQNTLPNLDSNIDTKIQKTIPVGPNDDAAEFEALNKHLVDTLGSVYEKSSGASSYCFIRLYQVLQGVLSDTLDSHIQEIYALFTHLYETFARISPKNVDFVANCVIDVIQDVLNNNGANVAEHWQHLLPHLKPIVDHLASSHTSKLSNVINTAINFVQGLFGTRDFLKNPDTKKPHGPGSNINIIIRIIKNFFVTKDTPPSTTEHVPETTTLPPEPSTSQAPIHNFHVIHIIKDIFGAPSVHMPNILDYFSQKISEIFGQNKVPQTTPEYTTDSVTEGVTETVPESTTVPSEYDVPETTAPSSEYTTDSFTEPNTVPESTTVPSEYETSTEGAQESSFEVPDTTTTPTDSDAISPESSPVQAESPGSSHSLIEIIKNFLGDKNVDISKIWHSLAPQIATLWESLSKNSNVGGQNLEDFVKTILTVLPNGSPVVKPKPQKPNIFYILNLPHQRQPTEENRKPLVVNFHILQRAPPNLLHTLHLVAHHYFPGLERDFFDFSSQLYQTNLDRYNAYPSEFLKYLLLESANRFHRPALVDALPGILHYYNKLITKLTDKVDKVGKTYSDLYENLNQKLDEKLKENTEHIEKIASDLQEQVNEKVEPKNKIDEIIESYAKLKTVFGEEKPQPNIVFNPSIINFHNSMDHYEINKDIRLANPKKSTNEEDCDTTVAPTTTLSTTTVVPVTETTVETTTEIPTEPPTEPTIPSSPPTIEDTSPETTTPVPSEETTTTETITTTEEPTTTEISTTTETTTTATEEPTTPTTTTTTEPTTTSPEVPEKESELPEEEGEDCSLITKKCSRRKNETEPEPSTVPPSTEPSTTTTKKIYGKSSDIEMSAAGHEEIFQETFNKVVQKSSSFKKAFFSIFSRLHDQFPGHEFDQHAAELYKILETTFSIYNEEAVSDPSFTTEFIALYNKYFAGKGGEFKYFIRELYEQQREAVTYWGSRMCTYYDHKYHGYLYDWFHKMERHFDPVCAYQAAESMGESLKDVLNESKPVADTGRKIFMDHYGQCFMAYLQTEAGKKDVLDNLLDSEHSSDSLFVSLLFRSYYEYLRRFSEYETTEAIIPFLKQFTKIYDSVKHQLSEDRYTELIFLALDNRGHGFEKTVDDFSKFLACSEGSAKLSSEDQALRTQMESQYDHKFYPNLFCLFILHPRHTRNDFLIYDTYLRHYGNFYSLQFQSQYSSYYHQDRKKASVFHNSVHALLSRRHGWNIVYKIPLVVQFFESVYHRFNGTENSYERFKTTFADVFEHINDLTDRHQLQPAIEKFLKEYSGEEELTVDRLYRELKLTRPAHAAFNSFYYSVNSRLHTDYNEGCFKVAFATVLGDASDADLRESDPFWNEYDKCYVGLNSEWHGIEYREALSTLTNEKLEAFVQIMKSLAETNSTVYRKSLHISPLVENVYRNEPNFAGHFVTIYKLYENNAAGYEGLTNIFTDYYTINGKHFNLGTGEEYTKIHCPPQDNEKITFFPSRIDDLLDACLYPAKYQEITDQQKIKQLEDELLQQG